MKKLLLTLLGLLFYANPATSQNLLTNGDFESGGNGVGFNVNGAGYNQINPPFSGVTNAGDYAFVTSPQPMNTNFFYNFGDHTTGSGKMMVIDGTTTGGQQRFWRAGNTGGGVCGLTPGNAYLFGYWIRTAATSVTNNATLPNIGVQFSNASNVQIVGGNPIAPLPLVGWRQVSYYFVANSPCVNIELYNDNTNPVGNDFALDDLFVIPQNGCTPPNALPVLFFDPALSDADSVGFDFNNVGQTNFTYSYTIGNGAPVTGIHVAPSNFVINNVPPGQPIAFTLTWNGICAPSQTAYYCPGVTSPGFVAPGPICASAPAPVLPTVSPSGITGQWVPATVSTTANGTYHFLPDPNQCSSVQVISITVLPAPAATFNALPTQLCQNTAAPTLPSVSANGINGTWSPAISTATPGTTVYTFTPAAGQCAAGPVTHSITVNPLITPAFALPNQLCAGAAAPTLPSVSTNGINGTWSPATVSNTATGTYSFTPAAGQCATPISITIVVNPVVTPVFTPVAPICTGQPAPVLPAISNNGISGTWSPAVVSNSSTATYTFTPSGAQCASTQTLTVVVNPQITASFSGLPSTLCQNATATAFPLLSDNGISGTWSPALSTATLGTTVYTFTPNAGQCASATPVTHTVTVLANTTSDFAPIGPLCQGAAAPNLPLISTNGITGIWSPAVISTNATANYTFTPNPGQCAAPRTITVVITPAVVPAFTQIPAFCAGGTAPTLPTVSINGVTGTWSPPLVDNSASGTYVFTPNAGQCASLTTMNITVFPSVSIGFQNNWFVCQGSTPPALPSLSPNGITGAWSPNAIQTGTTGNFTYTFTADPGQCTSANTQTITVTVDPLLAPDFLPVAPLCAGDPAPALLNASPNGITGSWNPPVINTFNSGSYTFTPDAGQCATPQTLFVVVNPRPLPIFPPVAPFCAGETAPTLPTVSDNGFTGTWSPAIVDNTLSGTYVFTPDPGQCVSNFMLNVTVNQPVVPDFPDVAFCFGTTPPALPNISPNGIVGTWNPPVLGNTTSGSYTFIPSAGQCATSQTIQSTVFPDQLTSVEYTITNYFADSHTLTVNAQSPGNYLYQLDYGPLQESNVFTNVANGEHFLTVIDPNGCSEPIVVNDLIFVGYPPYFTPNGDGYHDFWNVFGLDNSARIFIFNRHGKLLKQLSPLSEGWNGTYNGNPLPSDDYWFVVDYFESGVAKTFRSHFTLKR